MIRTALALALLVHAYRLEKDLQRLVEKHNQLVDEHNALIESSKGLQMGLNYATQVALSAFKRIPLEHQAELRNDIEFLDIAVREEG